MRDVLAQAVHDHAADSSAEFLPDLFEVFTPRQQCMRYEPDVVPSAPAARVGSAVRPGPFQSARCARERRTSVAHPIAPSATARIRRP